MTAVTYAKIPIEALARARDLTKCQYQIWLYLWECDPFGNSWKHLPTPKQIAAALGMTDRTAKVACARLEELGLFNFRITKWEGKNLFGAKVAESIGCSAPFFQNRKNDDIKLHEFSKNGKMTTSNCTNFPNRPPEPAPVKASESLININKSNNDLIKGDDGNLVQEGGLEKSDHPHTQKVRKPLNHQGLDQETQTTHTEPRDDQNTPPRHFASLKDFVIYSVKRNSKINNPVVYAEQCLLKNRDDWLTQWYRWENSRHQTSTHNPPPPQMSPEQQLANIKKLSRMLQGLGSG